MRTDLYHTIEHIEENISLSIAQRIREAVPEDFLILVNSNWDKIPLAAPYINGGFMETFRDGYEVYQNKTLAEIEDALLWFEENVREPRINCLRGEGIPTEPPDSPTNLRFMRLFTTMSLTLSDGYALYTTGVYYQQHFWYPFWDADLGQPIGATAQRYQNVPSLYIREFTNGWVVYNRSGKAQTITLPGSATPVSDRGSNAASTTHLLPDLDGEIYLKTKNPDLVFVVPTSTAIGWSTSWIWFKSLTASANLPQTSMAMARSTSSIWFSSSSSSANNIRGI